MQALLLSSCWPWKSYVISLSIKSLPVKWEYYYHLFCGCIIRLKRDNAWEELTHSRYLENISYCYYYRIQSTGRGTTLHSEETRFWDRDEGGNDRNRWQVTLGWEREDGAPYWCFPCSWWRTRWAHLLEGGTAGRTRFEESREPRGSLSSETSKDLLVVQPCELAEQPQFTWLDFSISGIQRNEESRRREYLKIKFWWASVMTGLEVIG